MAGKKAANGGGSQSSRSGSIPPPLLTSDAAVPSSDSLALPGPSRKKLFPLFDSKAKKNGKATPQTGNSDVESTATLSESRQTAIKKKKQPASKPEGKSKSNGVSGSQKSDASTSTKEKATKPSKPFKDKSARPKKSTPATATKSKSKSPLIEIDLDDPNSTISTVASTSTSSTTPPPEPHKTVITITDSPVREIKSVKTFADLDAERLARKAVKEAGGWNGGREPLWPTKDSLHVLPRDEGVETKLRPQIVKRDWKGKGRAVETDLLVQSDSEGKHLSDLTYKNVASVVQQYAPFPGENRPEHDQNGENTGDRTAEYSNLSSQDEAADHGQQTWYARYAPKKVNDVLGNSGRENAVYLRDWLRELTLQGRILPLP